MNKLIFKFKKGQSTVEYLVLVSVVISAIILFGSGGFKKGLQDLHSGGIGKIKSLGDKLWQSSK